MQGGGVEVVPLFVVAVLLSPAAPSFPTRCCFIPDHCHTPDEFVTSVFFPLLLVFTQLIAALSGIFPPLLGRSLCVLTFPGLVLHSCSFPSPTSLSTAVLFTMSTTS